MSPNTIDPAAVPADLAAAAQELTWLAAAAARGHDFRRHRGQLHALANRLRADAAALVGVEPPPSVEAKPVAVVVPPGDRTPPPAADAAGGPLAAADSIVDMFSK